jgi:hypothetical protein
MTRVLSRRVLNRSFLARQLLLENRSMSVPEALEHLVGLQAQSPSAPYVGLWTRLEDFDPLTLSDAIESRRAVRIALMRSTIHLVTAGDCLRLRPVVQGAVERSLSGYRKQIEGVDRDALLATATRWLEQEPLTGIQLEAKLAKKWRSRDPHALAMAVRCWLPLVQVPPRGLWGRSGAAAHTTSEDWLRKPLARSDKPDAALLRYLRAFGPASVKDFQVWSGLTGGAEIVDRVRSKLRTFRDENGTELVDVIDAPFPDPDTPVAPKFLPEYDNALLSHSDRERVITSSYRKRIFTKGGLLVGGFAVGRWWIATKPKKVRDLMIERFEPLSKRDVDAVTEEGTRVLEFAAGARAGEIKLI